MIKKIIFHSDAGHGWAEIPVLELAQLGINGKISSYSYIKDNMAYLEEDCDLYTYTQAFRSKYGPDVVFDWVEKWDGSTSPIRSYKRYC